MRHSTAPGARRLLARWRSAASTGMGVALITGVLLCLLASPGLAQTAGAAVAPRTLLVAAYPAIDEVIKEALPEWQRRHPDVAVKVVSRQFADHHTAMTTALSTGSHLPDVMALEVGYVGRFAMGGGLEDLRQPPFNIERVRDRFVPYAYQQALGRAGRVVAVPADIGPGSLLYRADILAKAGLTEADLTASWDSYVAAGVQLKARTGAYLVSHARDIKDVLIRSGLKPDEGLYFDQDSNVLVNSPRFVRAFELARTVRQNKLDAKVTTWSNDWSEGFRRGTLATQLSGAWLAGHLNHWLAPQTAGKWRAAQLPENTFVAYGGTFLAIAKASPAPNKALAWELIELLTLSRERQLAAFKAHDAFPALLDAHTDPFFEQPIAFLGQQPARLVWRDATRRISAAAVHKQDAFAEEVINTELDKVLDQNKPIAQALADAQRLLAQRARR